MTSTHQPLPATNKLGQDQTQLNIPQVMKSSIQKSPFVDNEIPKHVDHRQDHCEPGEKDVHQSTMLHLKDKLLRKYDSMENLNKIDQGQSEHHKHLENGHGPSVPSENKTNPIQFAQMTRMPGHHMMNPMGQNQQGVVYPQMFPGGVPMHPAFIGAAYNSMQAMNLLPAYNQHLAGMQQLAQLCAGNGQGINTNR